ncbi:zinc finger protein 615-like isoform X2 [Saccostrea cucullata]|uniref:zinc finger protein 615-like isoform X2 n=1 Tax=Saccostrea cuccullata TaxID=36930 RepID=UPI002ED3C293
MATCSNSEINKEVPDESTPQSTNLVPTIKNKLQELVVSRMKNLNPLNDFKLKNVPRIQPSSASASGENYSSDETRISDNQTPLMNQSQLQASEHCASLNDLEKGLKNIPSSPATISDHIENTNSPGLHSTQPTANTPSRRFKSLLTNKITQTCVNMNSTKIQQAPFNINCLGERQSSQPIVNISSPQTHNSTNPSVSTESLRAHQQTSLVPKNMVLSSTTNAKNAENSRREAQTKATTLSNPVLVNINDKVPSQMPVHQNTVDTISKPSAMNKTTVCNSQVLNNGVTVLSAVSLNQLKNIQNSLLPKQALNATEASVVPNSQDITTNCFKKNITTTSSTPSQGTESQNKTLSGNTSKTNLPADVEVTEQRFSVILQPVQKGDPPPVPNLDPTTVPNLDPPTEIKTEVKVEESPMIIDEVQSSGPRGEPQVESSHVTKSSKECFITDEIIIKEKSITKDKMEEMGYKFYKCGICQETFSDPLVLQRHVRQHKGLQSECIKCGYCEKIFSCKMSAFAHLKFVHGISCDKPKAGMKEANLATYEREEEVVKTVRVVRTKVPECKKCGKLFSNLEAFAQHKERSNCVKVSFVCIFCKQPVREETFEETQFPKNLMCNKCQTLWGNLKLNSDTTVAQNKQGDRKLKDAVHVDFQGSAQKQVRKKVKESYFCDSCQKSYTQKSTYVRHLKLLHSTVKPYKCDLCEKAFVFTSSLCEHRDTHFSKMRTKTFACDKCPKTFKKRYILKLHQQTHEPGKFPCDVCGKILKSKWRLIDHKRLHTGEKPFLCEICGKRFCSRFARILHMNTHDSSTKILCEICGKLLVKSCFRHHMVRHRIHDDLSLETKSQISDIPYVCEYCGKGFCERLRYESHKLSKHKHKTNGSQSEENHVKKKNNHGRLRCSTCEKTFINKMCLRTHEALHQGLMNVACDKCGKVMHKHSLRRHMLKMHSTSHEKNSHARLKCNTCEKTFISQSNLQNHEDLHRGLMRIACDKCGKVMHKHSLSRHMVKMHSSGI